MTFSLRYSEYSIPSVLLIVATGLISSCGVVGDVETPLPDALSSSSHTSASPSTPLQTSMASTAAPTTLAPTSQATEAGTTENASDTSDPNATSSSAVTTAPAFEAAPVMLRRLTRTQFRNAVRDELQFEVDIQSLDPDSWDGDFAAIGAGKVVTSERGVEQYHQAIETAVEALFADSQRAREFVGCEPGLDTECEQSFVERVGRLAWRRPLSSDEVGRVVGIARAVATDFEDPMAGMRWATTALFWSTNFLYRSELGTQLSSGQLRYTGYEMASRLAFLLWNSAPDVALLDAAAAGELDGTDGVRAAALRMLDTPAGRESVGAFAEEYMRLDRVGAQAKDPGLFPEYDSSLQAAMVGDMRASWQAIAFDSDGSAMELFSTNRAFVNAELAQLYGLDASDFDADTFREVILPQDSPRIGILSKAAFLSQYANQKEGSPTLRGKFIRQALMCMTVPAPPGNVDLVIDEAPADMPMTKRERLALHRENDSCANCHAFMDPLGLPLETFDAIGRYRTTELGLDIDPSGEFDGTAVANARELGLAVSASETVAKCMVRKFYSYAMGFEERTVDRTVLDDLTSSFENSGYKLRELVLAIVSHDAFASAAPPVDTTVTAP